MQNWPEINKSEGQDITWRNGRKNGEIYLKRSKRTNSTREGQRKCPRVRQGRKVRAKRVKDDEGILQ